MCNIISTHLFFLKKKENEILGKIYIMYSNGLGRITSIVLSKAKFKTLGFGGEQYTVILKSAKILEHIIFLLKFQYQNKCFNSKYI